MDNIWKFVSANTILADRAAVNPPSGDKQELTWANAKSQLVLPVSRQGVEISVYIFTIKEARASEDGQTNSPYSNHYRRQEAP